MTKQFKLYKKSFIFALFSLFTFVIFSLFGFHPAQAETQDSDITLSINSALALSLTNCDSEGQLDTSINNQVINLDIIPTPEGLFKSTCQTLTVNANTPGYTLTAKAEGQHAEYNSGNPTNTLLYQNPIDLTALNINLPTIPSTTATTTAPTTLTNNQWGFAVEGLNPTTTPSNEVTSLIPNFDSTYTINNANNTYAELPTTDTTLYKTTTFPLPKTQHNFFYATKLDTTTMAGTYATTITYTVIGEVVPPAPLKFKQVSSGSDFACAIASDNNAYCWGDGYYGALGNGSNDDSNVPVSVSRLAGGLENLEIEQISAGSSHVCIVASDNNAYCWGGGYSGKLGNGSDANSNIPVQVSKLSGGLLGLEVIKISAGINHTCAIASDNNAYCWGGGGGGRLGNGASSDSNIPVPVSKLDGGLLGLDIIEISAGNYHTCAIANDNNAYCWGGGGLGQLGDSTYISKPVPVQVSKLSGGLLGLEVIQISAGSNHTCAIANDNNAYCWGSGDLGQLGGTHSNNYSTIPIPVSKLSGGLLGLEVTQISAGSIHTCAIASDNSIFCWGDNSFGKFGNGVSSGSYLSPTQILKSLSGLENKIVTQISSGNNSTCIMVLGNSIYCSGRGAGGQLGNGLDSNSSIFVKTINPTP